MSGTADAVRVYFDTGIWVAYMLGERDVHFDACEPLIEGVENGSMVAVVTPLVIAETVHVLRGKLTVREGAAAGDISREDGRAMTQPLVDRFLGMINRLSKIDKIIMPTFDTSLSDHCSTVMEKSKSYSGHFRARPRCRSCGKRLATGPRAARCPSCGSGREPVVTHAYKALGVVDLEHAYLATYGNSRVFYTTDTSFRDLEGDPDFASVAFRIVGGPPRRAST